MSRFKLYLFALLTSATLLVAPVASAQTGGALTAEEAFGGETGLTAEELAGTAGLGTADPRILIARIINVALGFLGIIAVGFIIYAGFLWMTSQGNPEQIEQAKKILIGAVIGLIIILSSFAIAAFVMRALGSATGIGSGGSREACEVGTEPRVCNTCGDEQVCEDDGFWSACPICPGVDVDQFILESIQPADAACSDDNPNKREIRNAVIKVNFSSAVKTDSAVDGGVALGTTVKVFARNTTEELICAPAERELTAADVAVSFTNGNRTVLLGPTASCQSDSCPSSTCFNANEHVRVAVEGLIGANGKRMVIGATIPDSVEPVESDFFTSDVVDCTPPEVTLGDPGPVCAGQPAQLSASATDNESFVDGLSLYADVTEIETVVGDNNQTLALTNIPWTPAAGLEGSNVTLAATAYDRANNTAEATRSTRIYGSLCCNGNLDEGEDQIDCGGGCASCSDVGPIIDYVSPTNEINSVQTPNGAVGSMVTIGGRFFGEYDAATSKVYFSCGSGTAGCVDGWVAAQLAQEVQSQCTDSWTNNEVIAVVPAEAVDGPIKVARQVTVAGTAQTRFDATDSGAGAIIPPFDVNEIERPGLCAVSTQGNVGDVMRLRGVNFEPAPETNDRPQHIRFGTTAESAASADRVISTWNDTTVGDALIPALQSGRVTVFVTNNNDVASNYKSITIKGRTGGPVINNIQPAAGHPGDYVTISGSNFGSRMGVVKFGGTPADINFPEACGTTQWQNDHIIVKVPQIANASYPITVTLPKKDISDPDVSVVSEAPFRVGGYCNNDRARTIICADNDACSGGTCILAAGPGLCKLEPDNGPIGKAVSAFGERLGDGNGDSITFYNNQSGTVAENGWSSIEVKTSVPAGARTGAVTVTNNNITSNPLNFTVGSCLDNDSAGTGNSMCTAQNKTYCCEATTQQPGVCVADTTGKACGARAGAFYSQYYVEFSTAVVGGGSETGPQVIKECARDLQSCSAQELPSPSPWTPVPDTITPWTAARNDLACVNSVVTARFDKPIDPISLNASTVVVTKCQTSGEDPNTYGACNSGAHPVSTKNPIRIFSTNGGTGFVLTPGPDDANVFEAGAWYEVRLKGGPNGIKHATTSVPLVGNEGNDYVWHFKTRNDSAKCGLSCVAVAPANYTAREKNQKVDYLAVPQSATSACNMISGHQYSYQWSSDDATKATVAAGTANAVQATALAETAANDPVAISAKTTVESKEYSGSGNLTIDFPDFVFESVYPMNQCTTACTNADVGGYLNRSAISGTSLDGNTIKLFKCTDESCTANGLTSAISGDLTMTPAFVEIAGKPARSKLVFGLGGAKTLEPNTWYLAGVSASLTDANGTALSASDLAGTTAQSLPGAAGTFVTWKFKTGVRACMADVVDVAPHPAVATYVGQSISHRGIPYSKDTSCSVSGQKQELRGYRYDWQWKSDDEDVATLPTNLATYEFKKSDGTIQTKNSPAQLVTAAGLQENTVDLGNSCVNRGVNPNVTLASLGYPANAEGKYVGHSTEIKATIGPNDPSSLEQPEPPSPQNSSTFCLLCGHTNDGECTDGIADNGNDAERLGVGKNTCCFQRPTAVSQWPKDGGTNVCRNALVEVAFTQEMDITTFANNALIAANYENTACPDNTEYLELALAKQNDVHWWQRFLRPVKDLAFEVKQWAPVRWTRVQIAKVPFLRDFFSLPTGLAAATDNWCAIPGRITGYTQNGTSILTIAPQVLLPAGKSHVVLVAGDPNINDGEKRGVLAASGVTMRGSTVNGSTVTAYCGANKACLFNGKQFYGHRIDFTTLAQSAQNEGVCVADRVELNPAGWLFRSNQNDTLDDIRGSAGFDTVDTDSDKVFYSFVRSADGQPLSPIPGVYTWENGWEWKIDNTAIAAIKEVADDPATNDAAMVEAKTSLRSTTYIHATANITSNIASIPSSKKTGSGPLNVFVCQNPWPVFNPDNADAWPFIDGTFNFSLAYCRDKGGPAINDDLPGLDDVRLENKICGPTARNKGVTCTNNESICRNESGEETPALCVRQTPDADTMREYLFTYTEAPAAPKLMIYTDPEHTTKPPAEWIAFGTSALDHLKRANQFFATNETIIPTPRSGNGMVTLGWTIADPWLINQEVLDYYGVYGAPAGQPLAPIPPAAIVWTGCSSECGIVLAGIPNDQVYRFAVTAKKPAAALKNGGVQYLESAFSNTITFTPLLTQPAAPSALVATVEGTDVTLRWQNLNTNPVRHTVYYGSSSTDVEQNQRDAGTATTYTVSGLQSGRTYYFKVRAHATTGGEIADSRIVAVRVGQPVGYWKLDEGKDKELKDSSGLASNGTWKGDGDPRWNTAKQLFLQSNEEQYVLIADAPAVNLESAAGFTQQAWVSLEKAGGQQYYPLMGFGANSWNRTPSLFISTAPLPEEGTQGKLRLHGGVSKMGRNGWCSFFTDDMAGRLTENTWHHVAATYDKQAYAVYLDGQSVGRYILDDDINPATSVGAACSPDNLLYGTSAISLGRVGNDYFNGGLVDVAIYNYVRTAEQIKQDYSAQKSRFGL